MYKVLLFIIGIVLANFSPSSAQILEEFSSESESGSLRAFVELPEGFTYANRTNAMSDDNVHLAGSGFGKAGYHNAAAIELPEKLKQELKTIVFVTTASDKHGKVFIASRPTVGNFGWYTLEQVKAIETKTGLNSVEFDKPLITMPGKVYAVGYEVKSSGEAKTSLFPLVFIKQKNPLKEGCMISIVQGGGSIVHGVGKPIEFRVPTKNRGHLAIAVQGNNLARTFDVASEFIPTVYSQEGHILIRGTVDSFVVFDAAGKLVAQNSDTVLPTGTYVVKTRNGQMKSVTKVTVK